MCDSVFGLERNEQLDKHALFCYILEYSLPSTTVPKTFQ